MTDKYLAHVHASADHHQRECRQTIRNIKYEIDLHGTVIKHRELSMWASVFGKNFFFSHDKKTIVVKENNQKGKILANFNDHNSTFLDIEKFFRGYKK